MRIQWNISSVIKNFLPLDKAPQPESIYECWKKTFNIISDGNSVHISSCTSLSDYHLGYQDIWKV